MANHSNKKVLILLPSSDFGGSEIYVFNLAEKIRESGSEVFIAFRTNFGTQELKKLCDTYKIRYIDLIYDHTGDSFKSPILLIRKILETYSIIRKLKPDTVHISLPGPNFGLPFFLTCGILNIKTIAVFHSVPDKFILHQFRAILFRYIKRRKQSWIVLSRHMARIVSRKFGVKTGELYILPHGINPNKFPFKIRQFDLAVGKPIEIVSVGRLSYMKGYDLLLDALHRVSHLNWKCTIYGEGEERNSLEQKIKHFGLQGRVNLAGLVFNTADELNKHDLFVFPTRFEGFGLALFEAIFNGLPVITSDTTPITDYITDNYNGLVFKVGDAEGLQKKLEYALNNYASLKGLVDNTKELRETLTEEKMLRKTLALHLD